MRNLFDKALKEYENADIVIQMKARFFFFMCLIILMLLPVLMLYSSYAQLHNPEFGHQICAEIIVPEAIAFLIFIAILVLLLRGYFTASANMALILLFITVWMVMYFDNSSPISRLDTIVFVVGILILTPLAVVKRGYVIIAYGMANLAVLMTYTMYFKSQLGIPYHAFVDYVADNAIVISFVSITAFSIFIINRRALNRAQNELTDHLKTKDALQESEERYRMLFESSREAIVIIEAPTWSYVAINKAAYDMFKLDPNTLKTIAGNWVLAPEFQPDGEPSRDKALKMLQKTLAEGWCFFEFRHKRLNGEEFPTTVLLSKCDLPNRTLVQATMRDVSERKEAEEKIKTSLREKEVLLKEIHHRVKNNFQIIISLLNLQSNQIKNENLFHYFNDSINRIRAMALVHEKLYQSEDISKIDFASYITTISEELLSMYTTVHDHPELRIDSEHILLNIDQAIPCGLILNELLMNTLKYAFPNGGKGGTISVSLSLKNNKEIVLGVSDNGIGIPEDIDIETASTLGLQLVIILTKQINGTYSLDRTAGTSWRIIIPIPDVLS